MTQTLVRRLPGIRFERQAPPLQEVLPRMDIAGFVGFASSGPIDVPVPVEDAAQFTRVFGVDAPLAWDEARGESAAGFLGPAVRAFFRNGGRRCWIVRVADRAHAVSDAVELPGVAAVGALGTIAPALLQARSEGSWADTLRVSASLEPTPVRLDVHSLSSLTFDAFLASSDELVPGDLVRISFPGTPTASLSSGRAPAALPATRKPWTLYVGVESLDAYVGSPPWGSPPASGDPQLQHHFLQGGPAYWIRVATLAPGSGGHVHFLDAHGSPHTAAATAVAQDADGLVRLALRPLPTSPPSPQSTPQPGAVVRGVFATRTLWLNVVEVDVAPDGTRALVCTPFQVTQRQPRGSFVQAPDSFAEKLTLRLQVDGDAGSSSVLAGLGFLSRHPRFVGALPTDATLYADATNPPAPGTLAADAAQPRFPLAGVDPTPPLYLPLGATLVAGPALPALRPPGLARLRDGLESLGPAMFLDPDLEDVPAQTLLQQAFWIEYQQPDARPLRGIHSLMRVEEVTVVAVPDAVQRDWYLAPGAPIAPAQPPEHGSPPPDAPAPELRAGRDPETCAFTLSWSAAKDPNATYELQESLEPSEHTATTLYRGPKLEFAGRPGGSTLYYRVRAIVDGVASEWSDWVVWAHFLDCAAHVPAAPVLEQGGDEETGAFALLWSPTDTSDAVYELQESADPSDDSAADTLYTGTDLEFTVYGRPRGSTLYYRVRALAGGVASAWSNWVTIRTTQATRWLLDDASFYDPAQTLLPVQLALLRMCAARGDLFAVLALPEHYRERGAIAHVHTLKTSTGVPGSDPDPIFSYGALYHPWLYASDAGNPSLISRTPPDGAAAGVIAGRSTRRGAWVAPANEPLRDVVQLDPRLHPDWYQALQDAQVNVVRHEPDGFLWLAADTLSDDVDLRPIGVRRLLQTLRRAAILHGNVYAFEPNSDRFRRTVQRAFERLLSRMFELGAFAGATAPDAYRVNTGSPPNTPQSIDAGRLVVELQVAPSRPLAFLTVRLVRTGEGSLQVETR